VCIALAKSVYICSMIVLIGAHTKLCSVYFKARGFITICYVFALYFAPFIRD